MELAIKLKLIESRRKRQHKRILEQAITDLHNSIVLYVIEDNYEMAKIKSQLFLKYNRRLKYLSI
tara:strand:+ start:2355 stop:2549 length:195 start_codon:yes stop_codon:yes gene_type:complete